MLPTKKKAVDIMRTWWSEVYPVSPGDTNDIV